MKILDLHSHSLRENAIVSVSADEKLSEGYYYSVGIHPWYITDDIDLDRLLEKCLDDKVKAIGECGLDFHRKDISPDKQEEIFIHQIEISEQLEKPMIIHCVKAHEQLLSIHKKYQPKQEWIIHGFRQKPTIAKQFIDAGINISLGEKFNPETALIIPSERLFIETDDREDVDINMVIQSLAMVINKDVEKLKKEIEDNLSRLFKL